MSAGTEKLRALIERIFEDGVVEEKERDELKRLYRDGGLTVPQVKEVFAAFVSDTWGEVMSDGVVTDDERNKVRTILTELKLPANMLPDDLRKSLGV